MNKVIMGYTVLLTTHITGILFGFSWLSILTKPLLMPCLVALVWLSDGTLKYHKLLVASLCFAWLGDVLLMLPGEGFFIGGLVAFLSAHVVYIMIFSQEITFHPLRIVPFPAYVALLLGGPLYGKLPGDLQLPVYLYVIVLTGMGIIASLRDTRRPGYEWVLMGAILFILSDSFLALNKFASPLPLAGFWIMLTYGMAQFFIVRGYLAGRTS